MILDRKAFMKRLIDLRKNSELTTREFEEEIMNMTSWYSYEKGKCLPGIESTLIISNALNINIEWMLTGKGPKSKAKGLKSGAVLHVGGSLSLDTGMEITTNKGKLVKNNSICISIQNIEYSDKKPIGCKFNVINECIETYTSNT